MLYFIGMLDVHEECLLFFFNAAMLLYYYSKFVHYNYYCQAKNTRATVVTVVRRDGMQSYYSLG